MPPENLTSHNLSATPAVTKTPATNRLTPEAIGHHAAIFEPRDARALLRWAIKRFGRRLVLCTSFQAEGMVLLDIAWRIDPGLRVVTLDTGRLPQETYDLIERVRERYSIAVELVHPDAQALQALVRRDGPNRFYRSRAARQACCHTRKVEPLARALAQVDAWITGLRRGQSAQRASVAKIAHDGTHGGTRAGVRGIAKLSPLADWPAQQVWDYIEAHDVPYHGLYDQGYTSIGCAPCTRPHRPGTDARSGRWWWERGAVKECGLHWEPDAVAPASLVPSPVAVKTPKPKLLAVSEATP